jgi:iron complex outermembrane receptor protein
MKQYLKMKTMNSFIMCVFPLLTLANEHETIQILAPKQPLVIVGANQAVSDFNGQLNYSLNRTVADRLSKLVGVSLSGQGGQFQSYSIRGFSRGRIKTEIDGIPIITDRGAGNSASFIASDFFSVGTVVKGPSSSLYGPQALGGVVSLSTETSNKNMVTVSGNTAGEGMNFVVNRQLHNVTSAFAYQHANNTKAVNGSELNSHFERVSGLLRYEYAINGISSMVSWLPSYGKNIGKSNRKYPVVQISSYPKEFHSLAQIQFHKGDTWSAKLFHHYQNWDSETKLLKRYDGLSQYQSHTLGGQWLQKLMRDDFNIHWGVDWLSRKGVHITSGYRLFSEDLTAQNTLSSHEMAGAEDNLGLYGKSSWRWLDTHFDLGFRYDWVKQQSHRANSIKDNKLNASFAILRPVSDHLSIGLELATGFRFPTLTERFFIGKTPRGLIEGKRELEPETSIGSQLTVTWLPHELIHIYGAFYDYKLDRYIERYSVNNLQLSYKNLNKAKLRGFETKLLWDQNTIVEHTLSYQQQTGKDNFGQRLSGLHSRKLAWDMGLVFQDWKVINAIHHYFVTSEVGQSEQVRDPFTVWDISFEYQANEQHIVSLSAHNITNKAYYASLDDDAPFQPKRHVKLSTSWQF